MNKIRVRIYVGKKDLRDGVEKHCNKCPVALAAARAFMKHPELANVLINNQVYASVSSLGIIDFNNEFLFKAPLPKRAQNFITAFDNGAHMGVFKFKTTLRKLV